MTSNPRLQPDTLFVVDMFPYKKTELFQESGFKSKPPKKHGNTPLSGTYLSFLDINTTVSTCGISLPHFNRLRTPRKIGLLHPFEILPLTVDHQLQLGVQTA